MADDKPESDQPDWKCGIVRPIAEMDGYSAQHWSDVHAIMTDTLDSVGFTTRLVSDADEIGVIQGRIVKNLYEADLVVCDVSGKNPNVMFELGLRLAFDKPTIVIKDDLTSYSFDTSPIEHIPYPRDLRYNAMLEFKDQLARKAVATVKAPADPNYKSFLQHFGPIRVPVLDHQEVPADQYILDELREMKTAISRMGNAIAHDSAVNPRMVDEPMRAVSLEGFGEKDRYRITKEISSISGVRSAVTAHTASGVPVLTIAIDGNSLSRRSKVMHEVETVLARIRANLNTE